MGGSSSHIAPYTRPLEGSEATEKRTSIRRGQYSKEALVGNFETPMKNAWDLFKAGLKQSPDGPCLGTRVKREDGTFGEYVWKTYREVEADVLCIGSALINLNVIPKKSFGEDPLHQDLRFIAIFSQNREEWLITEGACNAYGFTIVPLYDTLGPDSTRYILGHTEVECIVSSGQCIQRILQCLNKSPDDSTVAEFGKTNVKCIINLDPIDKSTEEAAAKLGIKFVSWSEALALGKENMVALTDENTPTLGTVNTICYTSGTTGFPKGVIMTHQNFVAVVAAAILGPLKQEFIHLDHRDRVLSYLPLAHVYERFIDNIFLYLGASIGFFTGNTLKLLEDVQELKPTLFCSVPRLFDRINNRIFESLEDKPAFAKSLFLKALGAKLKRLRSTGCAEHALWDAIVFNKTKPLLGGRVRYMLTGSAPLDPVVHENIKAIFCVPVLEGYGLTETMGASILTHHNDPNVGIVGGPVGSLEICLFDVSDEVSEYKIDAEIPRGELCIRGPACTRGYFRNEAATAEAIDAEGWTHTGDIAAILPGGAIKIIDRKKNIFKLSQGEYVAPEKIERIYENSPLVLQAFVFGYSSESYLVAIFVLDPNTAMRWSKDNGKPYTCIDEMLEDSDLISCVQQQAENAAKEAGLRGFECVKKFKLVAQQFSIENDLLTPTFKLRRHKAKQAFATAIDEMYNKTTTGQ